MNTILTVLIVILGFFVFFFSLQLFWNIWKYQEAALGLIFNNLDESIGLFKIFAFSGVVFALSRVVDIVRALYPFPYAGILTPLLVVITGILLIYVFYKLADITKIKKETF